MLKRTHSSKRSLAQSSIELVIGLIFLVPLILAFVDLAAVVLAVQVNDSTCREAARVASIGDPRDWQLRANAVIARANQKGSSMLSNFQLDTPNCMCTISAWQVQQLEPPNGYGGTLTGVVKVQTLVRVQPFCVKFFQFNGGNPLIFKSMQVYPITFVVPNKAT